MAHILGMDQSVVNVNEPVYWYRFKLAHRVHLMCHQNCMVFGTAFNAFVYSNYMIVKENIVLYLIASYNNIKKD